MEELKHEQEMRERRNQDREHWRDGRQNEHSAVGVFPASFFQSFEKWNRKISAYLCIISSLF